PVHWNFFGGWGRKRAEHCRAPSQWEPQPQKSFFLFMRRQMSLYLITGIAGFIGSTLADALLQAGEQVRGVDNYSTGKRENIVHIMSRIDFREGDIADPEAVRGACQGVDYVLHQAAIPSVPRSVKDPQGSNRANVDGAVNLLVAARDAGVKRLVFAGSSSV